MVEAIAQRGVVDFKAEKERATWYGQTMKIFRGVPIFYSRNGEPAAESEGIPAEEVSRRNHVVFQANVQRGFGR